MAITEKLQLNRQCAVYRFVKFQAVNILTLFIEDNQGAETTLIHKIAVFGSSGEKMNVNEIKKQQEEG